MQTHWALHTANICHQVISYSLLSCLFWISELCELADFSSLIGFSVVCLFVLKVSSRIELSIVCSICKTTLFLFNLSSPIVFRVCLFWMWHLHWRFSNWTFYCLQHLQNRTLTFPDYLLCWLFVCFESDISYSVLCCLFNLSSPIVCSICKTTLSLSPTPAHQSSKVSANFKPGWFEHIDILSIRYLSNEHMYKIFDQMNTFIRYLIKWTHPQY